MCTWREVRTFASQKFRLTPESKISEKTDWCHFSFSAVAGVWVVFIHFISSEAKTLVNFGCISSSRILNRNRILKFESFLIRFGFKNFGTGAKSESHSENVIPAIPGLLFACCNFSLERWGRVQAKKKHRHRRHDGWIAQALKFRPYFDCTSTKIQLSINHQSRGLSCEMIFTVGVV